MPKLGKNKVGLYVSINKEIEGKLRRLIIAKYGEYRKGYLSAEVEAALEAWINTHKYTQANGKAINNINPLPRYYQIWQQVKNFIRHRYDVNLEEVHQIPVKMVKEAIAFIRGTDPRTVRKWLRIFQEQGLIKYIDINIVEVRG